MKKKHNRISFVNQSRGLLKNLAVLYYEYSGINFSKMNILFGIYDIRITLCKLFYYTQNFKDKFYERQSSQLSTV